MATAELVPALKDEVGAALRSVGRYNGKEHEVEYLREDVETIYDSDEIDDIFDDLALQGMSSDHLENLFNAGDLHCAMFRFDDALMFHFPHADFSGLFVTLDTGAGVDVESFVETCKEHT